MELLFDGSSDKTLCVYIPIINDEWVEYNETINLALHSEDSCVVTGDNYNTTSVLIIDDDSEPCSTPSREAANTKFSLSSQL